MNSRRQFIRALLLGVVGMHAAACATAPEQVPPTGEAGATAEATAGPPPHDAQRIVAIVQQKLNYLKLDSAGVAVFADAYQARQRAAGFAEDEDRIALRFLMSSDFFWNGADESRTVRYRAYHDPDTGCASPFARFD